MNLAKAFGALGPLHWEIKMAKYRDLLLHGIFLKVIK